METDDPMQQNVQGDSDRYASNTILFVQPICLVCAATWTQNTRTVTWTQNIRPPVPQPDPGSKLEAAYARIVVASKSSGRKRPCPIRLRLRLRHRLCRRRTTIFTLPDRLTRPSFVPIRPTIVTLANVCSNNSLIGRATGPVSSQSESVCSNSLKYEMSTIKQDSQNQLIPYEFIERDHAVEIRSVRAEGRRIMSMNGTARIDSCHRQ